MPMPPSGPSPPALAAGLDLPLPGEARALAEGVARAFGPGAAALIHYGSRAHGSGAEPESAWDFIVVLDEAGPGYRALAGSGAARLSPGLAAVLHRALPPNVVAVRPPGLPGAPLAKCAVVTRRELARGCAEHPRDHFLLGRLFQDVRLAWARDPGARVEALSAVAAARAATFGWVRTRLAARFSAEDYLTTLLAVSYAGEVRPESPGRIEVLVEAQRRVLLPILAHLLDSLAADGVLAREGDRYRDPRPPRIRERIGWDAYFLGSKLRNTLRWPKYVLLYDGWLDYVVRKVERRCGVRIELSALERRWPLLFLWPRLLRFLLLRPRPRA